MVFGAGEGNRTLVMSLGSSGNAIIRRPLRGAFVPEGGWELKRLAGFSLKGSGQCDFCRRQRAVLARLELRVQCQRAHALAVQAGDLVVEVAEHAFDLVVAAFMQGQSSKVRA